MTDKSFEISKRDLIRDMGKILKFEEVILMYSRIV